MSKINVVTIVVTLEALTGIARNIWEMQRYTDKNTNKQVNQILLLVSVLIGVVGTLVQFCGAGGPILNAIAELLACSTGKMKGLKATGGVIQALMACLECMNRGSDVVQEGGDDDYQRPDYYEGGSESNYSNMMLCATEARQQQSDPLLCKP